MDGIFDDHEEVQQPQTGNTTHTVTPTAMNTPASGVTPTAAAPPAMSMGMKLLMGMGKAASKPMMAEKAAVAKATGGFAQTGNAQVEVGTVEVGSILVKTDDGRLEINLGGTRSIDGTTTDGGEGAEKKKIVFVSENVAKKNPEEAAKERQDQLAAIHGTLCIVTKMDASGKDFQVEFLDKHREKLSINCVRHAGNLEREEFNKLCNSDFAVGMKRKREAETNDANNGAGRVAEVAAWSIIPGLLVRVVGEREELKSFEGKKAKVQSVNRKEGSARVLIIANAPKTPTGNSAGAPTFVTVLRGEVDTVIPQPGKKGLVIKGPHSGTSVVVEARKKNEAGDIVDITARVQSGGNGSDAVLSVGPDDICCVAP